MRDREPSPSAFGPSLRWIGPAGPRSYTSAALSVSVGASFSSDSKYACSPSGVTPTK